MQEQSHDLHPPHLGVQAQSCGPPEARADEDGGVEAIDLGHLQDLLLHVIPVQVLPDPVHCQGAGNCCSMDYLGGG